MIEDNSFESESWWLIRYESRGIRIQKYSRPDNRL